MPFVKIVKSNTYCSRYQTKYRRRREGKTDYQARRRLTFQDKNKYDTKKYRLVVRRTNRRILCSINFATLAGDMTMCAADSRELRNYGLTAGHANYASAYATGLLLARRLLTNLKMDKLTGNDKADGNHWTVEDQHAKVGGVRPFKANLDVGLIRTTTGNRVFGAMKGAADGGILVPHEDRRFPGFKIIKEEVQTNKRGKKVEESAAKKTDYDAKVMKDHMMGGHVQKWFDTLKKSDANAHKRQFSQWIKCLDAMKVKDIPAAYTAVHKAIRAKPARVPAKKNAKPTRKEVSKVDNNAAWVVMQDSKGKKWLRQKKSTQADRKARIQKVLDAVAKRYA